MNGRVAKHAFATRPGDADTWVRMRKAPISRESKAGLFTARLTIDDTPEQYGRIKVTTLQRGQIVADMLRELLARGFSYKRKVVNRRSRIFSLPPLVVLAFVRWASNDLRTTISRIDIVRAVALGEPYATPPFVRPGGDILLRTNGWPKVDPALRAIDAAEVCGLDPDDAAPDPWRYVHNRLTASKQAVPTRLHATWLSHCAAVSRRYQPRRNSRGHGARRRLLGAPSTRQPPAAVRLECQRQRADRSLRRRHIIDVHAGDLFVVRPAEPPARFPAARG
jgi:Protein of unknown function (DUF2840)